MKIDRKMAAKRKVKTLVANDGSHVPVRRCVICGRRFAKAELVRYVKDQTQGWIFDKRKIMPGRGWYCCQDQVCRARFEKFKPGKKAGKGGKRLGSQGDI